MLARIYMLYLLLMVLIIIIYKFTGRIVGFVSEIIALIGNESNAPAVQTLVGQLAASHKGRGIQQAQFNEFRTALVSYLSGHVSWNAATADAWTAGLDNIYGLLFAAL